MIDPITVCYASRMAAKDGSSAHATTASLAEDISFLLARASAVSLAAGNAALAAHGLKARSYSVLSLAVEGGRSTQRDIAGFLRLDPSQVVALVDDLQRRGLLERVPDPTDRRANVVHATAAGHALHAVAARAARAAEETVHSALAPGERAQLADLLRRIAFAD
jgi:DNA-binding MarR family transcriptional regulator